MSYLFFCERDFSSGLRHFGLGLAGVLLLVASPANANCSMRHPQIGLLEVIGSGELTILREGREFHGKNATILCVSDEILTRENAGVARLSDGRTLPIAAHGRIVLPGRNESAWGWLKAKLRGPEVFKVMGSMAGQRPGFRLVSLRQGHSVVDPSNRPLIVPVTASSDGYTVALFRADSARPIQSVRVPPRSGWVRFMPLSRRNHRYVLQIVETGERASFSVASNPLSSRIKDAGFEGVSVILAHACMNPEKNILDSLQRLYKFEDVEVFQEAMLTWQFPTDEISCSTPSEIESKG